ncbi:MAG: SAM-dependent methyltransferase [Candidatus Bathyarchaeia archaeon]
MQRADLSIVGIGIRGVSEITPETERILRRSTEIFYMDPRPIVSRYFNKVNRNSHNLLKRYKENRKAYDVYEELSSLVINSALKKPGACYATYGNPMIYDTITQLILQKAISRRLKVEIVPAVSALDSVLVDLRLPILDEGLQIFEANRLVLHRQRIESSVPCLIFGVGSFGTVIITIGRRSTEKRYLLLEKHLRQFYPSTHPIHLVESSLHPHMRNRITKTMMNRLGKMYKRINYNTTLYIPPVPKAKYIDRDFDSKIHSTRWTSKIVGDSGTGR